MIEWIIFFIFGILFIIFANLQAHYIYQLKKSLGNNSPDFYDIYFLWEFGIPGFVIPHPIIIIKYVWFKKSIKMENWKIIEKIRMFQILALFSLFLIIILLSVISILK